MKRKSKIDSINIRQSRFGITGIVYSQGYVYAVRFAPNAVVTEIIIRKVWRENRKSFQPYNDSTNEIIY